MDTLTESRQTVASYPTYPEAQRAVDSLSDRGFPVEHLSVVAQDLRMVESITGRHGYAQAAAQGLFSGALIGTAFGFLLGLLSWADPLISALAMAAYGIVLGAVLGVVVSLITHWASSGRRNFSSVASLQAGRYVLLCDAELAARARLELRPEVGAR